ncbi:MAG: sporulation initiation factor Spo0A C-terminal domain-containing protein [Oscillospiraceae bacterium]|nr:sporulation initiation factor Spo0A C-terminal domain-containing protein [Oscillospiraceae bacterium]
MIKAITLLVKGNEDRVAKIQNDVEKICIKYEVKAQTEYFEDSEDVNKTNEQKDSAVLDSYLSELFADIGMPTNLLGYYYLKTAINLVLNGSSYLQRNVTSRLYPEVAADFNTKPSCVEKAIRYVITATWDRGNYARLEDIFKYCASASTGKPTNSAFIARTVEIAKKEVG